jgi:hypothetical protein
MKELEGRRRLNPYEGVNKLALSIPGKNPEATFPQTGVEYERFNPTQFYRVGDIVVFEGKPHRVTRGGSLVGIPDPDELQRRLNAGQTEPWTNPSYGHIRLGVRARLEGVKDVNPNLRATIIKGKRN